MKELNQRYYELYDELYKSRIVLPKKQYEMICKALEGEYKRELTVLLNNVLLETAHRAYEQRSQIGQYLPRVRFFFFRNKIAKEIDLEVRGKYQEFLTALRGLPPTTEQPKGAEAESSKETAK